jgi:hypothetical protein
MTRAKKDKAKASDIPQMSFDDALRIALNTPPLRKEKKKRRKKARVK